jgi:DNA-binding winged helix-turn-helix (wHTH) protein/tetratricopeptide (TPR) repeat protein
VAQSDAGLALIYHFENYELDIEQRELRRDGNLCPIEPQVFNLLHFLIQNHERVVRRDDIFQAVWQGRIVSESVLSTRINAARKAIGDDGKQQRLIRTLRRNGFRFVGTAHEHKVASAAAAISVDVRQRKPSLVVLPFISMPADDELACLSKGISDDVVTALARGKSFNVIAHNNICCDANDLRRIAGELGVEYSLICAARRANGQVRLTVRLVDALTGIHIWAQSYTHELSAGFAGQDDISANITALVEPCIYAAEESRHRQKPFHALDASGCMLMALSLTKSRTRQNYAVAERLLQRAMALDPTCARAYSIAAWFAGSLVIYGWKSRESALAPGLDAAHKAVLLDDHDPWAHFALGWALTQNRSPEEGIEEYQKAVAINPYFSQAHSCLGLALSYLGRNEEALTVLDNGERLNAPEIFIGLTNSARAGVYFCAEKHHDAIKAARRSVQQGPGLVASQRQLVVNCALAGEMEEARVAFKTLVHLVPSLSLRSIAGALPHIRANDLNRTLDAFRLMGVR